MAEQPVRAGHGQRRLAHHVADHRLPLQHHELMGEHELAAFGGERCVDEQLAVGGAIGAQGTVGGFGDQRRDAMAAGERFDQHPFVQHLPLGEAFRHLLCQAVECMDVIARFVEPVARGLPGEAGLHLMIVADRLLDHVDALVGAHMGVVEVYIACGEFGEL